jgi:hypothetical protein
MGCLCCCNKRNRQAIDRVQNNAEEEKRSVAIFFKFGMQACVLWRK